MDVHCVCMFTPSVLGIPFCPWIIPLQPISTFPSFVHHSLYTSVLFLRLPCSILSASFVCCVCSVSPSTLTITSHTHFGSASYLLTEFLNFIGNTWRLVEIATHILKRSNTHLTFVYLISTLPTFCIASLPSSFLCLSHLFSEFIFLFDRLALTYSVLARHHTTNKCSFLLPFTFPFMNFLTWIFLVYIHINLFHLTWL